MVHEWAALAYIDPGSAGAMFTFLAPILAGVAAVLARVDRLDDRTFRRLEGVRQRLHPLHEQLADALGLRLDPPLEVAVGRGEDPHVARAVLVFAEPLHRSPLERDTPRDRISTQTHGVLLEELRDTERGLVLARDPDRKRLEPP